MSRCVKRLITATNQLLHRRALSWVFTAGNLPFSPSADAASRPLASSAAARSQGSVHIPSSPTSYVSPGARSVFRCKRQSKARMRTNAHAGDGSEQRDFVHKCVVEQVSEEVGNVLADSMMEMGASAATVELARGQESDQTTQALCSVAAFFTQETTQDERDMVLRCSSQIASVPEPLTVSWSTVSEDEWTGSIKEAYVPVQVSEKLWIVPQPDTAGLGRAMVPDDAAVQRVVLQPSTAWGDGGHPTTRMIIKFLNSSDLQQVSVLDYGCGTGILGITAALLGASKLVGLDIDPAAVSASKQNAQLNGVEGRCSFYLCGVDSPDSGQGDVFVPGDQVFDLCVANIFQKDLINLRDHICGLVRPGGTVIMSGLLKNQADDVLAAYSHVAQSFSTSELEGWVMVVMKLPSLPP